MFIIIFEMYKSVNFVSAYIQLFSAFLKWYDMTNELVFMYHNLHSCIMNANWPPLLNVFDLRQ